MFAAAVSGAVVVTANSRLARTLRLAFNRHQRASGSSAWRAPLILSWPTWLEELWSRSVEADGLAGERILLTEAQLQMAWGTVIGDGPQLPGDGRATAAIAARSWRLCRNWRISVDDLAAEFDSEDSRLFAVWARRFEELCRTRDWIDPDGLPYLLAEDVQAGVVRLPREVYLVGFEDWTPVQREFLRVVRTAGVELHELPAPHAGSRCVTAIACHDQDEELELAARWARQQIAHAPEAVVTIVVPDLASRVSQVRRAFLDVFAPDWRLHPDFESAVNFSYGEPLARVGMIHVAGLVLQAMSGRLDYQEAGQLLRTPYLPGSARESAAKARLDRELREQPGSWVDVSDLLSRAQSHAPEFARRLACVTRSTPQRQRAADWANCFQSVLAQCGWPGDRTLGSDEHQAGIAWQKQLEALRGCDHIAGPMSRESALGLLQSLLSERIFQPEGNPQAVQVLGVMEALGQTFDALWICGLTSDDWPPATRPDPLLPVSLQRRLSLPDSSPPVARERAERRLRWLETSAPEVMISWPEFSGDEPLAPSPLVAHLPVSSPDHLRRWTVPTHRQALAAMASADATVTLADDPAPPVGSAVTLRGGARLLEHQARCPARAFLEYRLGAREMRVPSSGIDAATRGLLMHSVLEVLYQRVASHDQLRGLQPAEVRALLDEIIETEIRHAAPLRDATMRRLARQEHQRLLALIGQLLDIERNRPPFVVRTTEQALSSTTGPPAIARLGLRLKIDRIDELPDGRRLVIDYKTGQHLPVAKELWGARPRSPQLPLYATLTDAHGIAFIGVAASGVRWLGVGHGAWHIDGVVEAHELTKGGEPDWGSLRASWWKSLDRIARELLEGDFRIDRWRRDEAEGQWAMATRVHELPDADDEEPDA